MTRLLLTGAGGFVGSHFLEHVLAETSWEVVATDSFRHKGKTDRIAQVLQDKAHWRPRVRIITHDLAAPFTEQTIYSMSKLDYIIAMASESHVDRSITDPVPFVRNNVNVALSTLELAREMKPKAVVLISTDEVYGPEPVVDGLPVPHPEWAPILPSNPYSASKAAQEAIAIAYWRTYNVPVIIVNCMNMIGERQDAEKFLPMLIKRISAGHTVPIHGLPGDIGTRHYLHARNLADGVLYILRQLRPAMFHSYATGKDRHAHSQEVREGRPGFIADRPARYNIVGPDRISNLELAQQVAAILGRPLRYDLVDFHSARPGHDPHYGLDPRKLSEAGWKPPVPFDESLARTVRWSTRNPEWLL